MNPQKDFLGRSTTKEELLSSKSANSQHEAVKNMAKPVENFVMDELQIAVHKYCQFQLYDFDPQNQCKFGEIKVFSYSDNQYEINHRWVVLTKTALQIFISYEDWVDEADCPLLQIPLAAIEDVIQQINVSVLNVNSEDEEVNQFLKNKMVIKLKEDFMNLYLSDQYSEYGLPDQYVDQIKEGQRMLDSNQLALKDFFHTLENQIIIKNASLNQNQLQMEQNLNDNPALKNMLINKMLIFSCDDQNFKNEFVDLLRKVIDIGDNWFHPSISLTENYDYQVNYN